MSNAHAYLRFIALLFNLAPLKQHRLFTIHKVSFLAQVPVHGLPEPFFHDVMHADGRLGVKSPELLKTSSSTRLKPLESFANAMLDCGVIADVKMQVALFLESAPVATV